MRVFAGKTWFLGLALELGSSVFGQSARADVEAADPPSMLRPAQDPVLGHFIDSFSDEDYLRQRPEAGRALFAGVEAEDVTRYRFSSRLQDSNSANRPSRVYGLTVVTFKSVEATIRAANAYLGEADPARGHALKWEIGLPRANQLYLFFGESGVTRREWDATSQRFLEAVKAGNAPRMICRDVGGCWIEGL